MLLIERECGVKMGVGGVGKYLKRWGFTPQKPIRRAYEQNPVAIQRWLNETYSAIAERAKDGVCERTCLKNRRQVPWQQIRDFADWMIRHLRRCVDKVPDRAR
jgi:hypothetical protein